MSNPSTIGVCVLPEPALNRGRSVNYPGYVHEILQHAGVMYETVAVEELEEKSDSLGMLITVGDFAFAQELQKILRDWVSRGGAWLSIGGICGMEDVLGAKAASPTYSGWGGGSRSLGEGYLVTENKRHRMVEFSEKSLHFFGGCNVMAAAGKVIASALDKHGRSDGTAAIIENQFGSGRTILICVDLPGTVVRIQQGTSVTRDGVPARDGSAPVDDSVLKSGDGGVLDWYFDRDDVPGGEGLSAFLRPAADQWREILLRAIFYLASEKQMGVNVLWMWPRNLPAIGHISHDSDGNEPEMAELLLAALGRAGICSTWCVILPGYSAALIEKIRAAGHELAMHYDAMTPGLAWGEEEFEKQWRDLRGMLGEMVTNKNHYLRWQGDMEFFGWCERRGIELDQSKGPSKSGEAGFNFGTTQPYFPVSFDGKISPVLEVATHTQDLGVFGPESLGTPLLLAALKYHGVAHFLFHPAHFGKPRTAPAMENIVAMGKARGMEWWTARQINNWIRARRSVRYDRDADGNITVTSERDLSQATVLAQSNSNGCVNDQALDGPIVRRWGFDFVSKVLDIPGRQGVDHEC
ncbi:MAG TPA: hypothetical protein VGG19_00365 [Tepidisphaeraceae bacterium]|jgi:peptidoglycan/xylan/chitin deacetylase (PgdA/CDA1 family)